MRHSPFLFVLILLPSLLISQSFTNGFSFYLPPDDTTRQAYLPHFPIVPIVDDAYVSISPDGHFALNGQRIRFFGTNCTIEGAFPTKAKAWYIAGRLRKMGYNLVRFHHMDNGWSQHSLFQWNQDTRHLNPETLDRLENFIYFLKQNGVYADINLHVSRTVKEADGVADADSIPDFGKGVSLFDPHILELHKEFAQQLLTHTNPYTGLALVDDPVMAVVEITNENSLYRMWRDDDLVPFSQGGKLTKHHTTMLDQQWHDFLISKYPDTQTLRTAWSQGIRPAGAGEQIKDGGFETDPISRNWQMEQHNGAAANMSIDETQPLKGNKCAKINVTKVTGTNWHIQWKQIGITIKKDSLYSVSFAGRANGPRNIMIAIQQDTDPWTVFYSTSIDLNSEWKTFQFSFLAPTTVSKAIRLSYSLGGAVGTYWFDEIQLYPSAIKGLADDESLEAETVSRINFSECVSYSDPRVRDMSEFYFSTQNHYYDEMTSFLKNTLGVKVPIVGTNYNVGPADMVVQSRLDYIDNHAYWDHPQFPSVAWDSYDWLINNTPMVRDDTGGAIAGLLAGVPFVGKPFTISEYNHAFPNRYQTEGILFLTAYSAFHDADGLMFFDYPSSYTDWETDYISGFFAQHRNTAMMALMPSCAFAFRSGLIRSAQQTIIINYSENDILSLPKYDDRWWAGSRLFPQKLALQHAVRTGSFTSSQDFDPSLLPAAPTNPYVSDTDEIEWDTQRLLQVHTDQFIAATGFFPQFKNTTIGALKLIDGSDFGALTWVSLSDTSLVESRRSLFTLSSRIQNSGMKWDGTTTVHNQWGSAPTLMAPIAVTIQLTLQADSIHVYTLDEIGAPNGTVYSYQSSGPNRFTITLDQNKDRTVWYALRTFGLGSVVETRPELPDRFELLPNFPNPFNPRTNITFQIPQNGRVKLEIYDLRGRLTQTLVDEFKPAGVYTVEFSAAEKPTGIYLCRLTAGLFTANQKMVLVR